MTNQEAAISILSYCADGCGKIDSCKCEDAECVEAVAIQALEKADKYKWHSMTDNPNDLPTHAPYIFVCKLEDQLVYGIQNMPNLVLSEEVKKMIIAWKYFEEYEVEE